MNRPGARFRAAYGSSLRHLAVLLACFGLTGWIALRLAGEPSAGRMLLWFVGAVVAHDLILFPIYATADQGLRQVLDRFDSTRSSYPPNATRQTAGLRVGQPSPPPLALNHVRVPALAAGLLFLVYLPGILRQGRDTYLAATGQDQQPYLHRWLMITGTLFLVSGGLYALRRIRRRQLDGLAR
ncbi:hypothetical protein ABT008_22100 [Micromonospora sp. NPDC002389]|uniref:hypothetical protein n=1 Tax=Micromonospora sp. NPDC002389 TaxID=3154272 RepID=UPI00332B4914